MFNVECLMFSWLRLWRIDWANLLYAALVECAVEVVVEDVVGVFEGLGDAVASVLVLEFEGVGGVVGIGDFGGDVGDDDGI